MDIVFSEVSKAFENLTVLNRFSFRFLHGERYCLCGPSGCGKTTLLNMASGLILPDSGRIDTGASRISYVFQENRLLPWATASQNITLVSSAEEAEDWLRRLGMQDFSSAFPDELSGGMKRRISIARALAAKSDAYFFDEPFQGLDSDSKQHTLKVIENATRGKLCLFVTHDTEDAHSVAHHVLSLSGPPLSFAEK